MTYHAASREALAATELKLLDALSGTGKPARGRTKAAATSVELGEELFAVVRLLDREPGLRRALGDSSAEPQAREGLLTGLLSGKVSALALDVLRTAVTARWSTPRELVDGLDELGRTALLVHAERAGRLDTVEDELFRFGRIVAGDAELEQALGDRNAPSPAKLEFVGELLGAKADPITVRLVEQLVIVPRGRTVVAGLGELTAEAAKRRERSVAYVVSAGPLSAQQQERLAATLDRIYARPIALHVEVDPDILGGLVIKVGDEVIDGSAIGRIDELRRRLAG
ncbi:MAG: F0F1 ATP synthase subunit delta [Actinophytocola sp.]|uniref:F0F1 ATP synthase subunit delta n=1 Tax=Actinophytocola sp. TaxID=1872138 RepID=UPI0013209E14|nr:F0F1 ATP synthase subunit delta [Actinophytocola sp.]MPZ85988.1 F0F1 ATP synthase subunit delta [Actinophytocola sp.]